MKLNSNKIKKNKIRKTIALFFLIIITLLEMFRKIDSSNINYNNNQLVKHLLNQTTYKKEKSIGKITKKIISQIYNNPTKYLLHSKSNLINYKVDITPVINENKKYEPIIYIYNTHQTEEYQPRDFIEYSVKPTVTMANYIMEETFKKNNYQTLVETASIKEILNKHNWNYSYSYKASRILLEESKKNYPTLKYYIDVHRDSVSKAKTTITINEKDYARLLFIVGLENTNYQANLSFTEEINTCLNNKYPSLSKGIYKKSGAGVNGIYNQDFSPYTILVEVGGYENTTNEVLNSSIAFSECFAEVISVHEHKANS